MLGKLKPAATGAANESGQWTWKHVALGAAGVLLIGISSYGIYTFLLKSDESGSSGAKSRSKASLSTVSDKTETSTSKTPLESAVEAKVRGNKYFKAREYEKAIECYHKALELSSELPPSAVVSSVPSGGDSPNFSKKQQSGSSSSGEKDLAKAERATFHHNLAAAYEKMESHNDVIRECSNCLEINPKYIKALSKRARSYKAQGDLENALYDVTAASVLEDLTNMENLQLSEVITKELAEKKAKQLAESRTTRHLPSKLFLKNYFASFTFDIFECELQEEIENPNIEESMKGFLKAKKSYEDNDFDNIEDLCTYEINKVGTDSPYYVHALLVRGTFRLLSGAAKLAQEDLDKVVQHCPSATPLQKSNALIKRGSLHMQNQQNFAAMADFEESVNVAKDSVDAHHHRGQLFLLIEDIDRCVEEFNKCIKLAPSFEQPVIQLCYANYKIASNNRDIEGARERLDEFKMKLKRFPRSSDGYAMYAQALADAGQPTEALDMFDKAISLCPSNAANYVHKAMLLLQLRGDYNAAIDLINQSLEKEPRNDFSYEMLGTIEIKRGDYTAAVAAMEKAIESARFEVEMARLFFMYLSALSWKKVKEDYGIDVSAILAKNMAM